MIQEYTTCYLEYPEYTDLFTDRNCQNSAADESDPIGSIKRQYHSKRKMAIIEGKPEVLP